MIGHMQAVPALENTSKDAADELKQKHAQEVVQLRSRHGLTRSSQVESKCFECQAGVARLYCKDCNHNYSKVRFALFACLQWDCRTARSRCIALE